MANWTDYDVLHMPPANESLDLEIEVNDFGRTTTRVTEGYYDGQLGHFRRLVGPIGQIEEKVLRWKLRFCEACGINFGTLNSRLLLDENGAAFWVCQDCEDAAATDHLLGIDPIKQHGDSSLRSE